MRRRSTSASPSRTDRQRRTATQDSELRLFYEEGVLTLQRIAELFDITVETLRRRAKRGGWRRRERPQPRDMVHGRQCPGLAFCPARRDSVARLHREAVDEITAMERSSLADLDPAERERRARTLASLTRTIERVIRFDADLVARAAMAVPVLAEAEATYDVEDLRRELAERIGKLRQGRPDGAAPG